MPAEEQGKRTRDREKDRNFQTNMAEKEHYSSRRRSPLVEKKSKDSQRRREEERLDRRHTDRTEQRSRSPARNRGEDSRDRGRERSRDRERRRDRSRERDHRQVDRGGREGERGGRQQHRRRDERETREERKFVRVKEERDRNDERRREDKQRKPENPFQTEEGTEGGEEEEANKDQPNFELSGALTEETNKFRGVVIKYREPPEARKPRKRWRLYPFKGEEALKPLHIHRQSAYLLGRERLVADIPIDHPSCSKQHAALQYRLVDYEKPDGTTGRRVKPYIIDLESANGTYVNNQRIEASRYVELMEKDVVKFGYSSREYVLLHDTSDTSGVQAGEDDEGLDD